MQNIYFNFSSVFLSIIDMEFAEPPLVFWLLWILVCIITFLFAGIAYDVAQVLSLVLIFFYYLNGINSNGLMIFSTTAFVFLEDLSLRLISQREIVWLSLFFILKASLQFFWKDLSLSFLANSLYFFGYLESIFRVPKGGFRLIFAFILTSFSITSSYASKSRSWFSN